MGSVFRFKKFEIDQSGCAMKINTDGVLLGAVADQQRPVNILDVGTGTGVIALMLAQRFAEAQVDAVEIDASAAATAHKNGLASPFSDRVSICHVPFEKYQATVSYDLIVSNPPYFVNDLKSKEKRKEIARHADEDFFGVFLRKASAMLTENGSIWLILPVKQAEKVIVDAVLSRLYPHKVIHMYSDAGKPEFRQIVCLSFRKEAPSHEELYIYESEGVYTSAYQCLLKDFFLAF